MAAFDTDTVSIILQLELLFRGVKRLEKQELKMLQVREEVLEAERRDSSFVVVVAPEDPSVCPMRLQSRAAERAKLLAAARQVDENATNELNRSNANSNEDPALPDTNLVDRVN